MARALFGGKKRLVIGRLRLRQRVERKAEIGQRIREALRHPREVKPAHGRLIQRLPREEQRLMQGRDARGDPLDGLGRRFAAARERIDVRLERTHRGFERAEFFAVAHAHELANLRVIQRQRGIDDDHSGVDLIGHLLRGAAKRADSDLQ